MAVSAIKKHGKRAEIIDMLMAGYWYMQRQLRAKTGRNAAGYLRFPLRSFKDPVSVDKHIIQPVLRLLVKNEAPSVSLAGTDAIKWSQQPTSAPSLTGHSK
jgi:hypothetical protein